MGYFEASYILYEVESPYSAMLGVALLAVLAILGFTIIWVKIKDLASGLEKTNQAVFKNIETVEDVVNVLKANNMISQDQYNKLMEQINSAKQDVNASQQFVNQVNQSGLLPTQQIMDLLKLAIVAGIAIAFLGMVSRK
jgi:endonuclease/exonuclease/phosphatase (EEP) superfamily protein YafD